jgi:hypothetical protein
MVENEEEVLDKAATSHDDFLDIFTLTLQFLVLVILKTFKEHKGTR